MTVIIPFLPMYVRDLGVSDTEQVILWSSIAFAATFVAGALVSPLWGRVADRFGRKPILLRASLGMAIVISLMGIAQDVHQFVLLRFLVGCIGGYTSAAIVLIATQAPAAQSGWALGTLSTGAMAGNVVGPLIGGILPDILGMRGSFFLSGGAIFLAFLATILAVKEDRSKGAAGFARERSTGRALWPQVGNRQVVVFMMFTAMMLSFTNMAIQPIITLYVSQVLDGGRHTTMVSGLVMSIAAIASIFSAPSLGRFADRIGAQKVAMGCLAIAAILLVPQAFVSESWQLIALRFAMGLALGGLLPAINTVLRHSVPTAVVGRILGYSQSAQYIGQIVGPLAGGMVGSAFGLRAVFIFSSVSLVVCFLMSFLSGTASAGVSFAAMAESQDERCPDGLDRRG
jgi:Arabinose efflux permease